MAYDAETVEPNRWKLPPHRPTPSFTTHGENRPWVLIDATDCVLGRLASEVSQILRGKDQPIYTQNTLNGRFVIIVNAGKIALTGRKRAQKIYYKHTGYPGGLKQRTAAQILDGKFPERVLEKAIYGMMPPNSLRQEAMRRLHIYPGPDHPHAAQQPNIYDFASKNDKNVQGSARMAKRQHHSTGIGEEVRKTREDIASLSSKFDSKFESFSDAIRQEVQASIGALREDLHDSFGRLESRQIETTQAVGRLEELLQKNYELFERHFNTPKP